MCDFGGEYALDDDVGYCSDITRTVAVGEPGAEVRDCYAVLLAAQQAAVAAVAARGHAPRTSTPWPARVIADAGLGEYFIHRTGHGIGIEEHEDPYLVAGNDTALAVGPRLLGRARHLPARAASACASRTSWWWARTGPEPLNTVDHSPRGRRTTGDGA